MTFQTKCEKCGGTVEYEAESNGTTAACPHCQAEVLLSVPPPQTEQSPLERTKRSVDRPGILNQLLRRRALIIIVGVIGLMTYNSWKALNSYNAVLDSLGPKEETSRQRSDRLHAEADNKLLEECTNSIVGLTRIVKKDTSFYDDDPNKWTAEVTAEYMNKIGGIERTNLPFAFSVLHGVDSAPNVYCHVDYKKVSDRENAAFQRHLEQIRQGND